MFGSLKDLLTAKRRTILTFVGVALAAIAVWFWSGNTSPVSNAAAQTSPGVIVARGRIEPMGRVLAIHGPTEANVIHDLRVDQGDLVTAGQILATFDSYDLRRADLLMADRNLRLAELTRTQITAGAKHSEVAAQRNAVAAKEAQLSKLKKEWNRRNALYEANVVSKQSLDTLQADLDQAASEVSQAGNTLKSLSETRSIDEEVASAKIEIEKAAVERARAQLEHTLARAPVAGTILSIQTRAGEAIGPDGLLRMAALDKIIAIAEVDEVDAPKIQAGMRATVEAQFLSMPVSGHVIKVANEVFRQKRPASDVLIGRDAKIVEVEVATDQPLPSVIGAEVQVRLTPAPKSTP